MEPEPRWGDATLVLNLLLDVQAGVHRLLEYFEEDDGEEEIPEEDT
jgi:hypothetical protein